MLIELRQLSEIKPYPGNLRQNDAAVEAVAKSVREFGFRQPIVVDADGVIVVGHTRLNQTRIFNVPINIEATNMNTQPAGSGIAAPDPAACAPRSESPK